MTISVYDKGDVARVSGAFAVSGAATDPTAVSLKFTKPSGDQTTYVYGTDAQLLKDSTGNYHADLTLDEVGDWHYQWVGTGAVATVERGQFVVQPTHFS